jgi:hypothetical protein
MPTNVPAPTFGDRGFMSPDEASILAGFIADWLAAIPGLSFTTSGGAPINSTPQGQLVTSESAIYANVMYQFMALTNGVDPAFATGRMQDAIARIYFLSRLPDQSTVVTCTCIGLPNTVIPFGTLVRDTSGNLYYASAGGTIPASGTIDLEFANQTTGPIPCPANSINQIYQAIPGWDTVNNSAPGVLGRNVEGRAPFEARREASVFNGAKNFAPSILGAVLKVDGVLDAYVTDNQNGYQLGVNPEAVVSASISGTTLTISAIISGTIKAGQTVTGADGLGIGVADGTTIISGSGTSWVVNHSQTVAGTTMNLGGTVLVAHSLYVAVVGGGETDVATAIWTKKPPGCGYNGNTTVTVYDTSPQYAPPGIPYTVVYEIPDPLSFVVLVQIANSSAVPANANTLIQNAVVAAFAGTDGGRRAGIGSTVFASRFYAGIEGLGDWAEIVEITLGTTNSPAASFTGEITDAVLTASVVTGTIAVGQTLFGESIQDGVTILSQASGTPGGAGDYNLSATFTDPITSEAMQTVAATLFRVPTKITQVPTVVPENIQVTLV